MRATSTMQRVRPALRRSGARLRPALLAAAALALALAAAAGAGCGESGSPSLEGSAWRLTGWSISGQDPNDFTITAEFKDGRMSGTSAVNQYGGPFTAGDDGSFSVGDLASTMMAGPEPDMQAEAAYMDLLDGAASFAVDGETLTLFDADGSESLIFTAAHEAVQ
ncbi:MAG: META domain-containing protein [Actinobacteria bacterium]|nr:META domain-containing protein [Actinomycetota bacterium]